MWAALSAAGAALIVTPARADFSRSNGFETSTEVKRPPRQLVTTRPDDRQVAEEDRIYNEMTLSYREDADFGLRLWLIAGCAAAVIVAAAVWFVKFRSRGGG